MDESFVSRDYSNTGVCWHSRTSLANLSFCCQGSLCLEFFVMEKLAFAEVKSKEGSDSGLRCIRRYEGVYNGRNGGSSLSDRFLTVT